MNYPRYVISNAFDTCGKYLEREIADCYEDWVLSATTDDEAIREAQALQARDDAGALKVIDDFKASAITVDDYEKLKKLQASYLARPRYVSALWFEEYNDNGDLVKERQVEL